MRSYLLGSRCFGLVFLLLMLGLPTMVGQSEALVETILQKGHTRYVSCLDYSPNGKLVATGSYDNKIILWNANNGKQIRTFSMHTDAVKALYFSPDSKHLLSTSLDNRVLVHEVSTGRVVQELTDYNYTLEKARYSADGSKIMVAAGRGHLFLWDAQTGEKIGAYKKDYSSTIEKQWGSEDGTRFLSIVNSKTMQMVNILDSVNTPTYDIEQAFTYVISPNAQYAAIGSYNGTASVYNFKTGKRLHVLEKPCHGCKLLLAFNSSGKRLVTATKYSDLVVWDVKKGTQIASFKKPEIWLDEVKFSPDGQYVIATGDGQSLVWNLKTERQELHLSYDRLNCLPAFSPDSKYLLTINRNNTAAKWNIATGKKALLFEGYKNRERTDGLDFDQADWYHTSIIKHLEKKNTAMLSPCGQYIAKGKIDSVALLLDIKTGKVERVFKGHSKTVITCAFSHDGKYLATGSGDKTIKLWEVATGHLIRTFIGHQGLIFDIKFSSDDKSIVSGSWDGSFRIWDTTTGKILKYVRTENASPYCIGFTPNDLYVVSGNLNNELKLWEADAVQEFRNMIGHTNIVSDVCFSPDGSHMVTASHDGKVKVWDFLSGMLLNKLSSHTSGVYAVAYHPEGKYIVSGSNDRTIQIWDPSSSEVLHTLRGHSGAITSLQISADAKHLVSCSIDGEVKVWDLHNFKELYTYIQVDRDNWLAKNSQGYFDGSSSALKHINYVSGLDVINVGSLFEKYYSPGLIRRIQQGDSFENNLSSIHSLIKEVPLVELSISNKESAIDFAASDSIVAYNKSISLAIQAQDESGGIDELRIYNNGKLVEHLKYANASRRAGEKQEETITIPVSEGENNITAIAFNQDRTESQPAALTVHYDGLETDVDLFIIAVGINDYKNPAYQLSYAIDDAKAYARLIKKNSVGIFNSVEEVFVKNDAADKKGIQDAFATVAKKAGPEDVFIFYFAGHGAMSSGGGDEESKFHIIPYDVTKLYGDDQMLAEKAISADEILQLSMQVTARKQIFVLDACQSGGALTAFNARGATREKAVAQLARSTGTFFLLASGAIQYASEARDLKHGIFTYALLEGLEGKADGGLGDKKITANELKGYVEDRVPQLTEEYMLTPQYPTGYSFGQDFPIVIVK